MFHARKALPSITRRSCQVFRPPVVCTHPPPREEDKQIPRSMQSDLRLFWCNMGTIRLRDHQHRRVRHSDQRLHRSVFTILAWRTTRSRTVQPACEWILSAAESANHDPTYASDTLGNERKTHTKKQKTASLVRDVMVSSCNGSPLQWSNQQNQ